MRYVQGNKSQDLQTALPDKYPQKKFNMKKCRHCGELFSPKAPSHLYCSQNCSDTAFCNHYLKRNYGITYAKYLEMYNEQGGVCKICGSEGFTMAKHHKMKLVVDHCHVSGEVRGLLCHNCNRGLGLFKDSKDSLKMAIEYLEGATTNSTLEAIASGSGEHPENG